MPVSFNNIPAGDGIRVPLFYAEMDNSMANSATASMRRLIVAQVNEDAQATEIGKLTLLPSEAEATRIGGAGSMLAQMFRAWRKNDPLGEVWCLPIKSSSGAAAKATVTLSGTATEAGTFTIYIGGERVQFAVTAGMTHTEAATALVAAITGATDRLPVTASASEAIVTVTAKFKGALGNDIKLEMNRLGVANGQKTPAGLTVDCGAMSTGSGDPELASALAALGDEPFEFICAPWTDDTSLNAWQEFMSDASGRWSYLKQTYGHVYTALRGTVSELVTAGKKRNDQHTTIVGVEKDIANPSWVVAAAFTARTAVFISADPARPTQTGQLLGLMPSAPSDRYDITERNTLLSNGIATMTTGAGGVLMIERAVTTYQTNAYGAPDNSYLDSETLHQSAYVLNALKIAITSKFGRHKLASDGTKFGPGQAIVTPKVIKAELIAQYDKLEYKGIVENSKMFAKVLIVERDVDNVNRINVMLPPDYVNQLRIFALLNQFRLQY